MSEDEVYDGDYLTLVRHRLTKSQYCRDYLYAGIRHLQRNCDVECPEHGNTDEECIRPTRYDGDRIADALSDGLKLLEIVEELLKDSECEPLIRRMLEGRNENPQQ